MASVRSGHDERVVRVIVGVVAQRLLEALDDAIALCPRKSALLDFDPRRADPIEGEPHLLPHFELARGQRRLASRRSE
jgi:hypothetical protein